MAGVNSAKSVDDNNGSGSAPRCRCGTGRQHAAQERTVNSNGTLTIAGRCMDITGAKSADGT